MNEKEANIYRILAAVVAVVIIVKIILSPISLNLSNLSINDVLSITLALFSVGLSVAFYLKAAESSNKFYDNTYKFTKDVSQILGRIEGEFGERLRHLDEGYSDIVGKMFDSNAAKEEFTSTKEKVEEEEAVIEKVENERNDILEPVIIKANLQDNEKQELLEALSEKDRHIATAHNSLTILKERLERLNEKLDRQTGTRTVRMMKYIQKKLIPELGGRDIVETAPSVLRARFKELIPRLPHDFISDMEAEGLVSYNGVLKPSTISLLKNTAESLDLD